MLPLLALSPAGYVSTLQGTSWRVKLDIGLERGSWMPRTVEGWGASGGRLLVDAVVDFEAASAAEGEELVGPQEKTRVLTVTSAPAKVVAFDGEREVAFTSGGWCVQRTVFAKPTDEGLLRFWLDCPSGAERNDVSLPPGERIFFSTGVWDSAEALRELADDAAAVEAKLGALEAEERGAAAEDDAWAKIPFVALRRRVLRQEQLQSLRSRRAYHESFPGLGGADRAALMAKGGSLSLKRRSGRGTEYHILGTFRAEPAVDEEA